jgi:hypothetical protein
MIRQNYNEDVPELLLPGKGAEIHRCANKLFRRLAVSGEYFRKGNVLMELRSVAEDGASELAAVRAINLSDRMERHFKIREYVNVSTGEESIDRHRLLASES